MFQIYAATGAALSLTGVIFMFIFAKLLSVNKTDHYSICALSDSLITVFMGILYVYSAIILASSNKESTSNFNFTNTIDDIVAINDSYEYNDEFTPTVDSEEKRNKTDEFLTNYRKFLLDILKNRTTPLDRDLRVVNNSTDSPKNNQIFQLNHNIRTPKELQEPHEDSYMETLYRNALLIYSFIHCMISVFNNTLQCKFNKDPNQPEEIKPDRFDNNSENEGTAPVEPMRDAETSTLEMFQVKNPHKTPNKTIIQKKQRVQQNKHILLGQLSLSWLLPIIGVSLLILLQNNNAIEFDLLSEIPNFNATRADPNILQHLLLNSTGTTEFDKVVENVYTIIHQVQANFTKQPPGMLLELLHLLDKKRDPKRLTRQNSFFNNSIKIYYLILFQLVFFCVVLFGKVTQVEMKGRSVATSKEINRNLVLFSGLWAPSVLDVLLRISLNMSSMSYLSDLFLSLGNSYQIFMMINKFFRCNNKVNVDKNTGECVNE